MKSTPRFEVVGQTPWDELEAMLRDVTLLNQPDTRPYANATLSIEQFPLSELAPTSKYVLKSTLAMQGIIRASLLLQGFDQLDLREGGLMIDGGQGPKRIVPPIVERFEEFGMTKYILDGANRSYLRRQVAAQTGETNPQLTVIFARDGVAYEPYADPNEWSEMQEFDEVPANQKDKKNYRGADYKKLYRDYSRVFDSAPRNPGSQA